MSRDKIENLAVIPNPVDNFDELWFLVRRANGLFVERTVKRLQQTSCGDQKVLLDEQVFLDSTLSYDDRVSISSVTLSGTTYTIFAEDHGLSNGQAVRLRNVLNVPSLSNRIFFINNVTDDTFELGTEVT